MFAARFKVDRNYMERVPLIFLFVNMLVLFVGETKTNRNFIYYFLITGNAQWATQSTATKGGHQLETKEQKRGTNTAFAMVQPTAFSLNQQVIFLVKFFFEFLVEIFRKS